MKRVQRNVLKVCLIQDEVTVTLANAVKNILWPTGFYNQA